MNAVSSWRIMSRSVGGEGSRMNVLIREARESDAAECGRICYEAFASLAAVHNFAPDVPNVEVGVHLISMLLRNKGIYGLVAELDGKVAGSNFLDERGTISGVGPVTIDPEAQNRGLGGRLMREVIARSEKKGAAGVRLVQAGYHCRSLSLYSKLGFEVREHLSCMQGPAIDRQLAGYAVRVAGPQDIATCDALALRVHGHHRSGELQEAVSHRSATVVERAGRITAYTTQIAFFGHAVAETTDDLKALIAASKSFAGAGFLVPSRNGELLRWCLDSGLRITQPLTLMTKGLYNEPAGAYLPSISY
jgi:predicted N-acetyltransferase YhbS